MDRRSRAERFKEARLNKGYSQLTVQNLCGVDKSFISRIENDTKEKFDPAFSNVGKLAKLYGVSVEQLMYGGEDEVAIEVQDKSNPSETSVKTIKLGTLSERALSNVVMLSQLPNRRTLNELLASGALYQIVGLLERAQKINRDLSLKINHYLHERNKDADMEIAELFKEARHNQRDMVEDLERLLRGISGFTVLETYKQRYVKMLQEGENNGEP